MLRSVQTVILCTGHPGDNLKIFVTAPTFHVSQILEDHSGSVVKNERHVRHPSHGESQKMMTVTTGTCAFGNVLVFNMNTGAFRSGRLEVVHEHHCGRRTGGGTKRCVHHVTWSSTTFLRCPIIPQKNLVHEVMLGEYHTLSRGRNENEQLCWSLFTCWT